MSALFLSLIAVRLPLMPFQGYFHDIGSYIGWGSTLVSQGFAHLYDAQTVNLSPSVPDPAINYPPGMPYLFGALVFLYDHTLALATRAPLPALLDQNGLGPFVAKLPLLLADIATTAILYREARHRHSQRFALVAAASYAFSPALLYNGVIWGQTDGLATLPLLVALFAIFAERYTVAGVGMATAVLLKPQPVIFIPLVLLYLWRWTRREDVARFAVALVATTLLFLAPMIVPRFQLLRMLHNMSAQSYSPILNTSLDAFNFWWFIGYGYHPLGGAFLGLPTVRVGEALFAILTLIIGIQIWRHPEPAYLFFGLALEMFSFFMVMGAQRQHYLFLFIPLALASLICSERGQSGRLVMIYVSVTALCLLNMVTGVGVRLAGVSQMIPYLTYQPLTAFVVGNFWALSWGLAAYHVATFAYAKWVFLSG
ncbi:MAG: DUF2029 domain-containing protein, partial [Chloroflexota bacterium]|nr:DUF2029 domain-containing protein [Chloroflexota bacterium]